MSNTWADSHTNGNGNGNGRATVHIVNTTTGEAESVCAHCVELERELRAKRSLITRLKNENKQLAGREPDHEHVVAVLEFWRKLLKPRATIVVNSDNWKAVRARLRDQDATTKATVFQVLHLKGACIGMLFDEWHMDRRHRYRRDPSIAFSNADKVNRLLAHAISFRSTYQISGIELVDDLGGEALRWLAERCGPGCQHLRAQHLLHGGQTPDGRFPCCVPGCQCQDFDPLAAKLDRWVRERQANHLEQDK